MYDLESTIGSQYANSPVLEALCADFQAWIDPTVNLQNFFDQFWNIATAQGSFLDQWGTILGISRYVDIPPVGTFFGFYDGVGDYAPFAQAPFYAGSAATQAYALSDAAYSTLLLAKAFSNICRTCIPVMNQLLSMIFPGYGSAFVIDFQNMTMGFYFTWSLSSVQQAILVQSGVLPHPTGVAYVIVDYDPGATFGFSGSGCQPFGQGVFYS